ncbi:MAG TPA: TlpA disulfide reductase family protein [Lysobacter sp.]|nr:TlpA disulfide reductase family protein [Lysobacter sp.]
MISLGPVPASLVVLLVALAIAVLVGRQFVSREAGQPVVKLMPIFLDMLLVGALAARLAFVLAWLPQYLAEPWSLIRIGDGGFSIWAGVLAGLAFGAWKARQQETLRRPLVLGATAGLASWAVLGGALMLMQQSVVKLPTTELATLDGGSVNLSTMTGKPMVVNLWATWCPPCRREMPVLASAQAQREDITFAFLNQGESEAQIREYLGQSNLQLDNVLIDLFSSASQTSGARGLPTTLFFDAAGRLLDTHMGELTEAGLSKKLQRFGPAPSPDPTPLKEVP